MEYKKYTKAFTLIEIIIVITILAILGTIGFLSFSSQSAWTRDSIRLTNMSNLSKGLSLYYVKAWNYPKPDQSLNNVTITASGVPIWYQWYTGPELLNLINLPVKWWIDQLDWIYFTYLVNANQSKYQILGYLEDWLDNTFSYLPENWNILREINANPNSYSWRYILTKWDQLWIILDVWTKIPIQSVWWWWIDIVNTTWSYILQFSSDLEIIWTWSKLKTWVVWLWLIWYWPFDEWSWNVTNDLSKNKYDWILSWTTMPAWTWWISWNSLFFTWWFVTMWDVLDMWSNSFSISLWFKIENGYSNHSKIINKWMTSIWSPPNIWYSIRFLDKINCNLTENCITNDLIWDKDAISNFKTPLWISQVPLSSWHNVVYVFNRDKDKIYLYLDGSKNSETSVKWVWNLDNNIPFSVWALHRGSFGTTTEYFKWLVDEIRTYDRVLSDSEISLLYNAFR